MLNATTKDALATDLTAEAHQDCIECGAAGCSGCPMASCDRLLLIEHCREHMHLGCVAKFDAHTDNKCTAGVCNCPVPELVDDVEETTPIAPLADREIVRLDPLGCLRRLAVAAAAVVLACVSGLACAHGPAPAVQVEQVGQLAAGPSVYSAPVHDTTPPPSFEIAGSADDDATEIATTTTRAVDAGTPDAPDGEAPDVVAKEAHGF